MNDKLDFLRNVLVSFYANINIVYDRCFYIQSGVIRTEKGHKKFTKECLSYSNFRPEGFDPQTSITHTTEQCSSLVKFISGCAENFSGTPSLLQCCFSIVKNVLVTAFSKTLTAEQSAYLNSSISLKKNEIAKELQEAFVKFNERNSYQCRAYARCYDENGFEIECPSSDVDFSIVKMDKNVEKTCLDPVKIGIHSSGTTMHPIFEAFLSLTGFKLSRSFSLDVNQQLEFVTSGTNSHCTISGATGSGVLNSFLTFNSMSSGTCSSGCGSAPGAGGRIIGFRSILESLKY